VVIDEAVEIGKTFGTAESGGFINGVLDAVVKHRTASGQIEGQGSGAIDGTV
jgi:transcription termination factor NusB